jgi:hypothetical protein
MGGGGWPDERRADDAEGCDEWSWKGWAAADSRVWIAVSSEKTIPDQVPMLNDSTIEQVFPRTMERTPWLSPWLWCSLSRRHDAVMSEKTIPDQVSMLNDSTIEQVFPIAAAAHDDRERES